MALRAVNDALSEPEAEQHCGCCLGHRRRQLDAEEHHRVLTASRAPGVEFMAIGATLHGLDCWVARAHSPLVVEPGGWRSVPLYLTRAEAVVWLSGRGRKRCKRCSAGV